MHDVIIERTFKIVAGPVTSAAAVVVENPEASPVPTRNPEASPDLSPAPNPDPSHPEKSHHRELESDPIQSPDLDPILDPEVPRLRTRLKRFVVDPMPMKPKTSSLKTMSMITEMTNKSSTHTVGCINILCAKICIYI